MVHNELQQNEKFLSDFKRSVGYLKVSEFKAFLVECIQFKNQHHHIFPVQLLAELDLLKGELDEDDDLHNIGRC